MRSPFSTLVWDGLPGTKCRRFGRLRTTRCTAYVHPFTFTSRCKTLVAVSVWRHRMITHARQRRGFLPIIATVILLHTLVPSWPANIQECSMILRRTMRDTNHWRVVRRRPGGIDVPFTVADTSLYMVTFRSSILDGSISEPYGRRGCSRLSHGA